MQTTQIMFMLSYAITLKHSHTVMEERPMPAPTIKRPTISSVTLADSAISTAPMQNMSDDVKMTFFRPNLSLRNAPTRAKMVAAPTVTLTINSWNV